MAGKASATGRAAPPLWRMAAGTIGARAIDLPSRYGFHLLVSTRLGLVDAGAFYIIFSLLTLLAGAGRLGIDRAMTREIARARARDDDAMVRRVLRSGLATIAALSLLAAMLAFAAAPAVAGLFADGERLTGPLRLAAIAIVPLCLSAGIAGALAGFQRVSESQMVYSWLWPLVFCLVAIAMPLTLEQAVATLLLAVTGATLLSVLLLWRSLPQAKAPPDAAPVPRLLPLGWSLFTTEIVMLLMAALPALMLGALADQAAVGAFAIAWRLALILNLVVVAIAAAASPRFADLAERGDMAGVRRTARQAVGFALGLGLAPAIILFLFADRFLALFGPAFASGLTAMHILLASQIITMMAAGTPEMLGMTGHERAMQRVNNVGILLYVPLLAVASWTMRDQGAAIATLLLALWTATGSTWLCRRHFGIIPLIAFVQRRPDG